MAVSVLTRNVDVIGDHNAIRRRGVTHGPGVDLQILHLHVPDDPLLALTKRGVLGDGIHTRRPVTTPTRHVTAPETAETTRRELVRPLGGGLEDTAKHGTEPGTEELEDHRKVGGDDCDERLAGAP